MKVEVAVLIVCAVSVDVKQNLKKLISEQNV